jgi:hypothetical protein
MQVRTTFALSCSGLGGDVQRSISVDVTTGGNTTSGGRGGGALGPWLLLSLLGVAAARNAMRTRKR